MNDRTLGGPEPVCAEPPPRAVIYLRARADNQAEEDFAFQAQANVCRAFAYQQGYTLVGEYQDSGASANDYDRPGLTALRAAVQQGDISIIVVYSYDRLFRDPAFALAMTHEWRAAGVAIAYACSGTVTSANTAGLMLTIERAFAEFERERMRTCIARRSRSRRSV